MKVLYVEDLANHGGPESWQGMGNYALQALTGGDLGWVLSREKHDFRAPKRWVTLKATRWSATWRGDYRPCAVRDPMHGSKHLARESGGPVFDPQRWPRVRIENPKGARR